MNSNNNKNDSVKEQMMLTKYEVFGSALNRIKEDEKDWIKVLLVMYGVIFTFNFQYLDEIEQKKNSTEILWLAFLVTMGLTALWIYHATNLRVQYYRTRLAHERIEAELMKGIPKEYEYWKDTRPFESKVIEITLSVGLFLVNSLLMSYTSEADVGCTFMVFTWVIPILLVMSWLLVDFVRVNKVISASSKSNQQT